MNVIQYVANGPMLLINYFQIKDVVNISQSKTSSLRIFAEYAFLY
jgi:hypothetical protein